MAVRRVPGKIRAASVGACALRAAPDLRRGPSPVHPGGLERYGQGLVHNARPDAALLLEPDAPSLLRSTSIPPPVHRVEDFPVLVKARLHDGGEAGPLDLVAQRAPVLEVEVPRCQQLVDERQRHRLEAQVVGVHGFD